MTKVKTRQLLNGLEEELQKFSSGKDLFYDDNDIVSKTDLTLSNKINKFSLENANQIVKVSDKIIEIMIDGKM